MNNVTSGLFFCIFNTYFNYYLINFRQRINTSPNLRFQILFKVLSMFSRKKATVNRYKNQNN